MKKEKKLAKCDYGCERTEKETPIGPTVVGTKICGGGQCSNKFMGWKTKNV